MSTKSWLESLNERDQAENVGLDRIKINSWILKKRGDVERIQLYRDAGPWRTLVKKELNLSVS